MHGAIWFCPYLQVAQKLGVLYSEMIFVNGHVHCDPHPGNILVRRSPKHGVEIVFLDHGLYQVWSFSTHVESTDSLSFCRKHL